MSARYASPHQLRDGAWGVRVSWKTRVGEIVQVRSAKGKVWRACIVAILWTDNNDGSMVCKTRPLKAR